VQVAYHVLGGEDVGDTEGGGGRPALSCRCAPHQDGSVHVDGLATYKDLIRGWVTGKREELAECRSGEAFGLSGLGEPEVAVVRPGDPALHLGRVDPSALAVSQGEVQCVAVALARLP
jgi:hypothetical protein